MLPTYPREVTELTTIKVNKLGQRSPSSYVQAILQLPVDDPRYHRDQFGTKCNFYVHDVLRCMGIVQALLLAKDMIKLWRLNGGSVQKMAWQDAITNANLGCPTTFGLPEDVGHSHVGVILPQAVPSKVGDTMVANVGATNFYGRQLRWAIQAKDLPRVEFFGAP